MVYNNYNNKVDEICNIIKENKKLITTGRKGHNHRDLQFKVNQKKIDTSQFDSILAIKNDYIDCESSVSVGQINRKTIPKKKWYLHCLKVIILQLEGA